MCTVSLCSQIPSSLILSGSGGKNVASSSLACSILSLVVDPSDLTSGGILLLNG
jgi:hypothetical protein